MKSAHITYTKRHLSELKEERPLEYERLLESGELEKHLVQPSL